MIITQIIDTIRKFLHLEDSETAKTRRYARRGIKRYKNTLRKLSYE
jgi:hypothetical protein